MTRRKPSISPDPPPPRLSPFCLHSVARLGECLPATPRFAMLDTMGLVTLALNIALAVAQAGRVGEFVSLKSAWQIAEEQAEALMAAQTAPRA